MFSSPNAPMKSKDSLWTNCGRRQKFSFRHRNTEKGTLVSCRQHNRKGDVIVLQRTQSTRRIAGKKPNTSFISQNSVGQATPSPCVRCAVSFPQKMALEVQLKCVKGSCVDCNQLSSKCGARSNFENRTSLLRLKDTRNFFVNLSRASTKKFV